MRAPVRFLHLLILTNAVGVFQPSAALETPDGCVLSADELKDAAATGPVTAYEVKSIFLHPAESPARVATPFVRATWTAKSLVTRGPDAGAEGDLDACADETWFIFPVQRDEWASFEEQGRPFEMRIRRKGRDSGGLVIPAAWIREMPLGPEWRARIGAVPGSDLLIVGAFPRTDLRDGDRIELQRRMKSETAGVRSASRIGVIAVGDLRLWR